MSDRIPESRFYMWRTLFSLVHADGVVTVEEIRYVSEILEDEPFYPDQIALLKADIQKPQDTFEMFEKVTETVDQAHFFKLAQELVHCDGDYGKEEQEIMLRLKKLHVKNANWGDLIGKVELSFEEPVRRTLPVNDIKNSGLFEGLLSVFAKRRQKR